MIFVVDDEPVVLEVVRKALSEPGYAPEVFLSGSEALARGTQVEPELIVSDIRMPEMDGYAFQAAYQLAFPERDTPFLFLSSLNEPKDVLRGLDAGAIDHLAKPVSPQLLVAKIKSILGFREKCSESRFTGDLVKFPFPKILQYCELRGFTGVVAFKAPGFEASLPFRSGVPALPTSIDSEALISSLFDLNEGQFTFVSRRLEFQDLALYSSIPAPPGSIQSEGGTPFPPPSPDESGRNGMAPPREVPLGRSDRAMEVEDSRTANLQTRFLALFEEGFHAYRDREFHRAVVLWEQAQVLNPTHKALETNLEIARKKVASQPD
jgi:CheY-like chemotaxis protein